jgi:hypothetical protein
LEKILLPRQRPLGPSLRGRLWYSLRDQPALARGMIPSQDHIVESQYGQRQIKLVMTGRRDSFEATTEFVTQQTSHASLEGWQVRLGSGSVLLQKPRQRRHRVRRRTIKPDNMRGIGAQKTVSPQPLHGHRTFKQAAVRKIP